MRFFWVIELYASQNTQEIGRKNRKRAKKSKKSLD